MFFLYNTYINTTYTYYYYGKGGTISDTLCMIPNNIYDSHSLYS